jgi:glycosyltransferase involved in cell wall biosynthesis
MKILYDHQIFSRQKYGGISRYFHEISNRIPTLEGDKVEVFAPLHVNEYGDVSNASRPSGIQAWKFPGTAVALGIANTVSGNLLVRWRKDVSIFHETYYATTSYAPASAKRVITVYDMIHELFPESFSKADMTRRIKRRAVRRADHVICISESTRRDLVRIMGIPEEKTSVVYLGHSLTGSRVFAPAMPAAQQPFLLYVGKRVGYKNFKGLLAAYADSALLRDEFNLVCFGGGRLTPGELSATKALGLKSGKVICVSGDDAVLAGLYASAEVLVYPSLYEGFGIPPLEAMAHGCPVVCSNLSSLPEVVGNAARLFDPSDQDSLREAIEQVVCSSEISERLVMLGNERIKHFSWDKCALETLREYKRILGN